MQRASATLLLTLFSVSLMAPFLSADPESKLPPCCRKNGKHHCAMMRDAAPPSAGAGLTGNSSCPFYRGSSAIPIAGTANLITSFPVFYATVRTHSVPLAQTASLYRISYSRAANKRGPPSFLLS
jgi:hypothetical protein